MEYPFIDTKAQLLERKRLKAGRLVHNLQQVQVHQIHQMHVIRLHCDRAAELIRFNFSQFVCFHWLWLRCISIPLQLR